MGLPPSENRSFTALLAVLLLLASGCAPTPKPFLPGARGVDDYDNQYRSTVQVHTRARECRGVLLELHLVLTSAACVCLPPAFEAQVGSTILTPEKCEKEAFVHLVRYVRQWDGKWRAMHEAFEATAIIHEGFRAEFQDGKVLSHTADLAVLEMEYSMWGVEADGNLPRVEVSPEERLIQVGFGPSSQLGDEEGVRRFGETRVTSIDTAGANAEVRFRTSGVPGLTGDSGGPVFRENAQGRWLAGIHSGWVQDSQGPWFTSTFFYRDWLEQQKKR